MASQKSSVPRDLTNSETMLRLMGIVRIISARLTPSKFATFMVFVDHFNFKLIDRCEFLHSCLHLFTDDEYLYHLFIQSVQYNPEFHEKVNFIIDQETNNNDVNQNEDEKMNNESRKHGTMFLNRIERVVKGEIYESVLLILIGCKEGKIRLTKGRSKILSLLPNHKDLAEELDEILENMEATIVMKKSRKRKRSSSPSSSSSPSPSPRESKGTSSNRVIPRKERFHRNKKLTDHEAAISDCEDDMYHTDMLQSRLTRAVKTAVNIVRGEIRIGDANVMFYSMIKSLYGENGDEIVKKVRERHREFLPVIIRRLEQKLYEITNARESWLPVWKQAIQENSDKIKESYQKI